MNTRQVGKIQIKVNSDMKMRRDKDRGLLSIDKRITIKCQEFILLFKVRLGEIRISKERAFESSTVR